MVYGWFNIIWRVCWFEESHCSPAFLKGTYSFHRTSCSNFCWKSTVINAQKHLRPFSFNFTISQQQLRLFIRYSKCFNRPIVHCTCKDDFRNSYFSKELLFGSIYGLNFLLGCCSCWKQVLLRGSIWSIKFL